MKYFTSSEPLELISTFPVGNYMFKVNNRNTRTRCEKCSKLTVKTSELRYWRRSGVFIVNFEHISHLVLVFLLLILSRQMPAGFRDFCDLKLKSRKKSIFKIANIKTAKLFLFIS